LTRYSRNQGVLPGQRWVRQYFANDLQAKSACTNLYVVGTKINVWRLWGKLSIEFPNDDTWRN